MQIVQNIIQINFLRKRKFIYQLVINRNKIINFIIQIQILKHVGLNRIERTSIE